MLKWRRVEKNLTAEMGPCCKTGERNVNFIYKTVNCVSSRDWIHRDVIRDRKNANLSFINIFFQIFSKE